MLAFWCSRETLEGRWCVTDVSMAWSLGEMAVEILGFQGFIRPCPGSADGLTRPYTAHIHDALIQLVSSAGTDKRLCGSFCGGNDTDRISHFKHFPN